MTTDQVPFTVWGAAITLADKTSDETFHGKNVIIYFLPGLYSRFSPRNGLKSRLHGIFRSPGRIRTKAFRARCMRGIPLNLLSGRNTIAVVTGFLFDLAEHRGGRGMKPARVRR